MTGRRPRRPDDADRYAVVVFPSLGELRRRLPRLVAGLVCLGVGIAMTLRAELGVSPYDVLHQGLARVTGLSVGTVVIALGAAILLLWIPLRQRPGLGTVVNTATVGLLIDATLRVLPHPEPIAWRAALLVAGTVIVALGIGLYIGSGLGPGPRDGLMTGLAARGYPLWLVRTGLELGALVSGWFLGGDVGPGTVLFAFAIGPLGHRFLDWFHLGVGDRDPDPDAAFGE